MKDVRIVVVSWNVEKLLERCLRSLPQACEGLDWEAVVVDNASGDGSVALGKRLADQMPDRIRIIANPDNRGFAVACNQGIKDAQARFVLLLNPDTECPPLSVTHLVLLAVQHPEAGIFGPKLLYPDGEYQPSVRRFPTVWSQAGVLLKLHHLFPWLLTFRRYFYDDLEKEDEQYVDQVMGACFLIRRELIEQIGGMDERYFLWFEEVDYCRMAKEKRWLTLYAPSISVIHHQGRSFGQVLSFRKQRMLNDSLLKYFRKWQPGWRPKLLRALDPISKAQAWILDIRHQSDRQWIYWLGGIVALETLSFAIVFTTVPRIIATVLAGVGLLILTQRKPYIGLAIMLLELMIGSKGGGLFRIPQGTGGDQGISLRIVLTVSFVIGWLGNASRFWYEQRRQLKHCMMVQFREAMPWFAVAALCFWGVIRGWQIHNVDVFKDANAWFYLVLLIPTWSVAWRFPEQLRRHASQAAIAGLIWLPVKTLGLLYVFSHGIKSLSQPLYLWVRRTGVGEVTLVVANLFRLFIQSQVYAIAGALFAIGGIIQGDPRLKRILEVVLMGSIISIVVGLSRSFWIGTSAGIVSLFGLFLLRDWQNRSDGKRSEQLIRMSGRIVFPAIIALALIYVAVAFPVPKVNVGSLQDLFGSRNSISDAAAESRWNLLPALIEKIKTAPILGSGFGATVTYASQDPRVLATHPDGMYTTYAFEWGWLEHWIKFGILGIPVILWLFVNVIQRVWKTDAPWWQRAGFVSSLIAIAVLHIFTPYLNHPLGFGFLLVTEGFILSYRSKEKLMSNP